MPQPSRIILLMTLALLLFLTPRFAPAESNGPATSERVLPDEDDLRALGDLAERMMRNFADKVDPLIERLQTLIDDIDAYEAPERLPNGDIIIRRKPDSDPPAPLPPPEGGIAL